MAKQKSCHKFIYKLNSKRLRDAKWNLTLPLEEAMNNENDIVALNDSQILRWILEYRGITDLDIQVAELRKKLKYLKKQNKTKKIKDEIKKLYSKLYSLQFQPDYLCIIMDSNKDYDRCNQGFTINGIKYKRLLGTNGGIKKSTIVYVSEEIYPFIKSRIDNGRNMEMKFMAAKLEAYQALVCSGSIPIPMPRICVINDVFTMFTEDVITIADDEDPEVLEPILEYHDNYEIEYCDSDGYGFMSPTYSQIVNRCLESDDESNEYISGINTRYAWTKGMVFTFDFVDFAEKKNNGTYMFKDAWGEWRDCRDYDVILTTSQVKLWDSYNSLEDYINCCNENKYEFSVAKTTPHKLENARNSNYQFLQSYHLTDKQIQELCSPTIKEIKDVLGNDWRKTITFLKGFNMTESDIEYCDNDYIKAIMINPEMVNDPFIISRVNQMIKKKISDAAKGTLKLHANFAIISGDLYTLAQSMFGHKPTGLLKKGEIYSKYWIDQGTDKVACFRAPMTCHNNIRVRTIANSDEMAYWYQYDTTGVILNSWDSTCDATNGSDKDGDMFFTTDNKVLVDNVRETRTIECVQKKGAKIIPTEEDIVRANKLAFGDEIGTTTNHITAMIEVQSQFPEDSREFKELEYRIMCGQHLQQASIDKAKGIVSKPMPKYWYNGAECSKRFTEENGYTEEEREFQFRILADKKPYFMTYVYKNLASDYKKYIKSANGKCYRTYHMSINELMDKQNKTEEELEYTNFYKKLMPVGINPCTINRIAWMIEDEFKEFKISTKNKPAFDYTIMKSNAQYTKHYYNLIKNIKDEYDKQMKIFHNYVSTRNYQREEVSEAKELILNKFRDKCYQECPNEKELCNIVLDMCYTNEKSKQFAWDMCSHIIIDNMLEKSNNNICYPLHVDINGEFEYGGEQFIIVNTIVASSNFYDNKTGEVVNNKLDSDT